MSKKNKINDGHYLEAMDRLHLVADMMDRYLMDHPIINQTKDLKQLVNYSIINLMEVYQRVGNLSYLNENEKNPIDKVILRRRKKSKK